MHLPSIKAFAATAAFALALFASMFLFIISVTRASADTAPSVTTDKDKYSVGETMTITGAGFTASAPVEVDILRPDHNTDVLNVSSDSTGGFVTTYSPNPAQPGRFKITATDGTNAAKTAATQADAVSNNIDQCQNGGVGATLQPCNQALAANGYGYQGNANSNGNNSHWTEGDFVPLRIIGQGYSAGPGYVKFSIDITKSGKHAYDYIGSFDQTETTGTASGTHANHNDPVSDIISGASPTSPDGVGNIPSATLNSFPTACGSNTFTGSQIAGQVKAWGVTGLTVSYVTENVGSSDCVTTIKVAWTGTTTGFNGTVVLAYGAHIAKQSDWGTGNSAININGSPYHTSLVEYQTGGVTKGIGQQDAKLAASAIVVPSTITIHKVTSPNASDPTVFSFTTTGTGYNNFTLTGGNQNQQTVTGTGSFSVTEGVVAGWTNSNLTCTASGTGSSATPNLAGRSVAITIGTGGGATIDCTYTNTLQQGHIQIIKNTVGGDDTFGYTISGPNSFSNTPSITTSSGTGRTTNAGIAANAGTGYSVTESTIPSGWSQTNVTCSNGTSANFSITAGATTTCTFTNTKQATLKVIKVVNNNHGGTLTSSDFPLFIDGGSVTNNVANVVTAGVQHTVSETQQSGYTQVSITGDCDSSGHVTLQPGDAKTCTITNQDIAPQLTVIKHVVNDNGGAATAGNWTMNVTATNPSSASFAGAESPGTTITLNAGSFSVAESGGPSGYTQLSAVGCSGTIAVGETKTCTITNDDQAAHLIVIKHVDNGTTGATTLASAFTTTITGVTTAIPTAAGAESPGVDNVLTTVGTYSVDERAHAGYTKSLSTDCSGTIALGQTKTCTITNTAIAPTLTINKIVVNDNGGKAVENDFQGKIDGANVAWATLQSETVGSHTASETNLPGYTPSTWSGDCATDGTVTLALGDNKTCTITNDDIAPKLHLRKVVLNDNGGDAKASDWTLTADGTDSNDVSGASPVDSNGTLQADTFALSESGGPSGYTASDWVCVGGQQSGSNITLGIGEEATCTITNDDQQAYITVTKIVNNNYGGTAAPDDFHLTLSGNPVSSGVQVPVNPGTYTAGETNLSGYHFDGFSGDCDSNGSVTVALGQSKTCTLTNSDIQPQLTVIKHVINHGGNKTAADFTMNVTATNPSSASFAGAENPGTTITLNAGTYLVEETPNTNYTETKSADCSGSVAVGDHKMCTITNEEKTANLTIVKDASPNDCQDFAFTLTGKSGFSLDDDAGVQECTDTHQGNTKSFTGLDTGNYTIGETEPNQYWTLGSVSCVITGTQTPFASNLNGTSLSVNLTPGSDVTCTFVNNKLTPTRTLGFWKNHTAFTSGVLTAMGSMPIGNPAVSPTGKTITTAPQLFGAYFSSVPKKSTGVKRNALDQARIQLLWQLITAKLNCYEFNCPSKAKSLIFQADQDYSTGTATQVVADASALDAYNNSGDTLIVSGTPGKATPSNSSATALLSFWDPLP